MSHPYGQNPGNNENPFGGGNSGNSGSGYGEDTSNSSQPFGEPWPSESTGQGGYNQQNYGQNPYPQSGYDQQNYGQSGYGYDSPNQYSAAGTAPSDGQFDAMDSIGQAWKIFAQKPGAWVLATLIYFGLYLLFYLVGMFSIVAATGGFNETSASAAETNPAGVLLGIIGILLAVAILCFGQLVFYREGVKAVSGQNPSLKDFFSPQRVGIMFVVTLVVALLSLLGVIALLVGAFVVGFFLVFAVTASVFEDMTIGLALKSSFEVAKRNWVQTLFLIILMAVINWIGGFIVIGTLVTYPLSVLAYAHAYMTATGRHVQTRA